MTVDGVVSGIGIGVTWEQNWKESGQSTDMNTKSGN